MRLIGRKRAKLPVLFALFSLFLQIFIPFAQAVTFDGSREGFPDRFLICTVYGLELFDSRTGKTIPEDPEAPGSQSGTEYCPVCLAYAIGGNALANAAWIDIPRRLAQSVPAPVHDQTNLTPQLQIGAHGARAPPALI